MAVSYVWPPSLPQKPDSSGYSESSGVLMLSTPMDAGPAKLRRRGKRPERLSVSFYMTDAQVSDMETFVQDTIRGTARFGFTHPRKETQVEVRIVPNDGGELYTLSPASPAYWLVSLNLEVLP